MTRRQLGRLARNIALTVPFAVGLLYPRPFLSSLAFTITFLIVLGSIIAACTCRGLERTCWLAFSIPATVYFAFAVFLGYIWSLAGEVGLSQVQPPRITFATSYVLGWLFDLIDPERVPGMLLVRSSDIAQIPSNVDTRAFYAFMTIGHCLFTTLIGIAGVTLAEWIAARDAAGEGVSSSGNA